MTDAIWTASAARLRPAFTTPKSIDSILVVVAGVNTRAPETWTTDPEGWFPTKNPEGYKTDSAASWLQKLAWDTNSAVVLFEHQLDVDNFSWSGLLDKGNDLHKSVAELRKSLKYRSLPITFVAHSLGGLIVKQAIRLDSRPEGASDTSRFTSIAGTVFFGTPHTKNGEDWTSIKQILKTVFKTPTTNQLAIDNCQRIVSLCTEFAEFPLKHSILSIYDGKPSGNSGKYLSGKALCTIGVTNEDLLEANKDHEHLVLFDSYGEFYGKLSEFVGNAFKSAALQQAISNGRTSPSHTDNTFVSHSSIANRVNSLNTESESGDPPFALALSDAGLDHVDPTLRRRDPKLPCFAMKGRSRNRNFFGRETYIKRLEQELLPTPYDGRSNGHVNNSGTVTGDLKSYVLCGLGGIGKTQIAQEFVFIHKEKFDAIFWISADNADKLAIEFANISVQLGLEDLQDATDRSHSRSLVMSWLSNPYKTPGKLTQKNFARWLLVFDSVDEVEILNDYWPTDCIGSVLVTSRDPLAKRNVFPNTEGIDVPVFSQPESVKFLIMLTNQEGTDDPVDAAKIAKRLSGLPLAISQIAGIINRRDLSFPEFLETYSETLKEMLPKQIGLSISGYQHTLATVWSLEKFDRECQALLDVLCLLDVSCISEEIVKKGAMKVKLPGFPQTTQAYQRTRGKLTQASLVTRSYIKHELVLHSLTQDVARAQWTISRFQEVFEATVSLVCDVWPFAAVQSYHQKDRWETCESNLPHVNQLMAVYSSEVAPQNLFPVSFDFARLLNDTAWYSHVRGGFSAAAPMFKAALSIFTQLESSGQDCSLLLCDVHYGLGAASSEMNLPLECLEHFQAFLERAQDITNKSDESPEDKFRFRLAIAHNERGNAAMMTNDYENARDFYLKSIQLYENVADHKQINATMPTCNLGLAYHYLGDDQRALPLLLGILAAREEAFGKDDVESFRTGRVLHALGNVYASIGQPVESFHYHQRALRQYRTCLGDSHHRTGDLCYKMAEHYFKANHGEAKTHLDHCLQVFREDYHKPERARAFFKLAELLDTMGQKQESESYYKEAIAAYRELRPKDKRPRDQLKDSDFDKLVIFWSR